MTQSKAKWGILIVALTLAVGSPGFGSRVDAQAAPDAKSESPGPTPAALAIPVYKPPRRGIPGRTVGGGTRGGGPTATAQPILSVLAPEHLGLTVRDQPTLLWYSSEPTTARVELTLSDETGSGRPAIVPLPTVSSPGIHSIRLADFNIRLKKGVPYEWTIALVPDPHRRTPDMYASGGIERIQPPAALSATGQHTTPFAYAESGIWYDALAALSESVAAAPNDPRPRLQRAALLEQVGLGDIATEERRRANQ